MGLLATRGTLQTEIYHSKFSDTPIDVITPDDTSQNQVLDAIYEIKAGHRSKPRRRLLEIINDHLETDAIIAGCTEISLVLSNEDLDVELIDPMVVLADEAIKLAKQEL